MPSPLVGFSFSLAIPFRTLPVSVAALHIVRLLLEVRLSAGWHIQHISCLGGGRTHHHHPHGHGLVLLLVVGEVALRLDMTAQRRSAEIVLVILVLLRGERRRQK